MRYLLVCLSVSLFFTIHYLSAQTIKLNQIGFYPNAEKIAVVPGSGAASCKIVDEEGTELQTFPLASGVSYLPSGETVQVCDFTAFTQTGRYKLIVDGVGESYTFDIKPSVHMSVLKASLRAFYYHRASSAITAAYGGTYTRASGHPDMNVTVHASAVSAGRPAGTVISCPKGWYDAGDYNKYIVNSGITTFTLLSLYEHYPDFFNSLELTIPETGNNLPDILDETLWNLEWMLSMQDPGDGGVYHKCTSPNFTGTIMPSADNTSRVVVMKTTAATLNFAAVMAVASRIFKDFETEMPGFSAQCLAAAEDAWNWAKANPTIYYTQPAGISTGQYGDNNVSDEFDWASAELFITTGDDTYLTSESVLSSAVNVPAWQTVAGLAWVSLGLHRDSLSAADKTTVETKITNYANGLYNSYNSSGYKTGMNNGWFFWGSNGAAGNQGLMMLQGYHITGDTKFLRAAQGNLDYLLGKNATGFCFLTGSGSDSPKNIHHRISAADNIPGPLPGFIAGGPNAGQDDGCAYPSNEPALSYVDSYCSYASNEIAINWNAPFVYLAGALEAIMNNDPAAPAILIQPTDISGAAGTSVTLNAFAPGSGLSYQWQKDGVNIPGETSQSLTLSSLSASDEADYRLLVYNSTDTVISRNASFTLLVKGPYGGTRHPIPGTIKAVNYDEGGQNLGYYDSSPGNDGGAYRNDDVDIGGTTIGWTANNEWLSFSVQINQTGNYQVEIRTATPNPAGSTGRLSLLVDGVTVASNIIPPSTGGWNTYQSIFVDDVALTAGDHDLRVFINNGGFNLDDLTFSVVSSVIDKQGTGIHLYPNPSSDRFTLSLDAVNPGSTFILTSIDGKEIIHQAITNPDFTFGNELEQGVYIGRIIEEDKVRVFEVVKF